MGRLWLVPVLVAACSDPATQPDAGIDAGADADTSALSITPAAFNFGELELGSTNQATHTFVIKNESAAPIDLASIEIGGAQPDDFRIDSGCGPMLEPAAACSLEVAFDPIARDMRAAQLEVTTGASLVIAFLQGVATVRTPRVIFAPGSHDFGNVAVGETSPQLTFDVINEAATGTFTATIEPSGTPFSVVSSDCGAASIPLHGACSVTLQLAPGYGGEHLATLKLSAGGESWGAGLIGHTQRPLALAPYAGAMGSMLLGQPEATLPRTFTVKNEGTATTGALTASFVGAAAADYAVVATTCTTLDPDASCDVIVHLAATTRGNKQAQLSVGDGTVNVVARANLSGSAYSLLVTGTGAFPSTTNGQQSAPQTFTVINASDRDSGAITTSLGPQFAITGNTCAAGIAAHDSCAITVRFTPTSAGAKTANLGVSATIGGSDSAPLSGSGL